VPALARLQNAAVCQEATRLLSCQPQKLKPLPGGSKRLLRRDLHMNTKSDHSSDHSVHAAGLAAASFITPSVHAAGPAAPSRWATAATPAAGGRAPLWPPLRTRPTATGRPCPAAAGAARTSPSRVRHMHWCSEQSGVVWSDLRQESGRQRQQADKCATETAAD
jgi:hypothetical protein